MQKMKFDRNAYSYLPENFKGTGWRVSPIWDTVLPVDDLCNRPINYLEIGVFYGANLFSLAKTFAMHEKSTITGIDPWKDYKDYNEYVGKQDEIYKDFCENLNNFVHKEKIQIYRDFSFNVLPKLNNEYYEIIYIDGNHEPEGVLEDAVLSARKLKPGGYMIFDDYGWKDTHIGINAFVECNKKHFKVISVSSTQFFLKKNT